MHGAGEVGEAFSDTVVQPVSPKVSSATSMVPVRVHGHCTSPDELSSRFSNRIATRLLFHSIFVDDQHPELVRQWELDRRPTRQKADTLKKADLETPTDKGRQVQNADC